MPPAPIECLPPELLHPIFALALYPPSLPASSSRLAAQLSSTRIYHAVCSYHLKQDLDAVHTHAERSAAQTRIFSSRWMTWDFFQSWMLAEYGHNGCLCGMTPETGCFDPIWPPNFADATQMVFSRSHLFPLAFIKCRIPVKLLQGPWTVDKVCFLRFLLWTTSMTVDWKDEATRRATIEGRKEAVLDNCLEAVELFNHNRRLGRTPGLEQVRFEVIEGGCNRSIVYDTMYVARKAGLFGDSWRCAILDRWCEERPDDPRAEWLFLKLNELRATTVTTGKRLLDGQALTVERTLDPDTGNYTHVEGDQLMISTHRWNQASPSFSLDFDFEDPYLSTCPMVEMPTDEELAAAQASILAACNDFF